MSEASPQVLVVGAGPTGLLLAVELARRDVSCVLIDAFDAPRGWDRATVVHPRSMEIFEALGVAEQFLDRGVRTRAARFRSGGELLGELDLTITGSRYDFDLGISEEVTESVLTECLEQHGGAVTRSTRLVELRQDSDRIAATLDRDGERDEITASWVVGCDGLHSVVREHAGIEFPGTAIAAQWAVFDATAEGWDEEYDVAAAFLDDPAVILTPLPDRRWRVYLRPRSESGDLVAEAEQVVRSYKRGVAFAEVENPARFHCHSRVATRFRSGRVLLAGDAAHVCSPAEGHGMNTGIQDAFNLGWKLALVCHGISGPSLLDSYEAERRPVAMRVAESGNAAEAGQAMTADEERAARDADIRQTYSQASSSHHEAVAAAELDRSYADSGVVGGDANGHLPPGVRLPDALSAHPHGGAPCSLHELTHRTGHTLLVLGGPKASASAVRDLVTGLERSQAESPVVGAILGFCTETPDLAPLGRIDASIADELGIDEVTVFAVRPDRYVGFRLDGTDAAAVGAYVEALTA